MKNLGNELGRDSNSLCLESCLLFTQIDQDLSAVVGCANLHNAKIIQHELDDVRLYPPSGICRETSAPFRIKFFDGLQQANVSFLNQVQKIGINFIVKKSY